MFQRDLRDPDFLLEQREKIDPKPGLLGGGDVRPPVTNVHVFQCDEQARKEADPQPAADPNFHPQCSRGGRFQPGFVGIGVHNKKQGHSDEGEETNQHADGEQGDSK